VKTSNLTYDYMHPSNWNSQLCIVVFTSRETGLLYYDGLSTESNKKSTALVIAHELAHMWFGNLVTLQWWDYTWLNEGFARLFQYISTDTVSSIIWIIKLNLII
jgi:aminopeptidase N